jgi:hypothetical protein
MSEKDLQERMANWFSRYFHVQREVLGYHKGEDNDKERKYIDLVLVHKSDDPKNPRFPFGIEVKLGNKKKGKDLAKWLLQAIAYRMTTFTGYHQKLMVMTFPQLSGEYLEEGANMSKHNVKGYHFEAAHHNVGTFLGGLGIGEVQKYIGPDDKVHIRFVFSGGVLWDSRFDDLNMKNIYKYTHHGKNK